MAGDSLVERLLDDAHMIQRDGLGATLATAKEAADRIAALEAEVARTMSDHGRMIWPADLEGICPTPDVCGEYETVRCSPCAIKQAEAAGVQVLNPERSYSPEVCRLKRENAALVAEVDALRAYIVDADNQQAALGPSS